MKKILFLFITIQSCFFYGQEEGDKPKPPKFSSSDRAGILYYEVGDVAENVKIKDDSDQFYDVAKAIRNYNSKVKEVAFLNSKNFKDLDLIVNDALNNRNNAEKDPAVLKKEAEERKHLKNVVPKARKKIIGYIIILNEKLKTILSEKQHKKWIKYQKKQMRTLIPEKPSANSGQGKTSRSGFGQGPNFGNGGTGSRGLY